MSPIKKSRFSNRCLVLCCLAGAVVASIGVKLVELHIVDAHQPGMGMIGGILDTEILPARRGLIMDAREEVLTNNVQTSDLIGDWYHLQDPKIAAWALAFSKAQHSDGWDELSDIDKEKRVKNYRARLLAQAASKAEGRQEFNIAQILMEDNAGTDRRVEGGEDVAHKKLETLYDLNIAMQYVRAHEEYAAKIITPYIEGMSYEEILQKIRQDGVERPQKRIVLAKNISEEKSEQLKKALQEARVQGFALETVQKRNYAVPNCLTHVLGYVGQQTDGSQLETGVSGLESKLDKYLLGQNGLRENRKDSRGLIIPSADDRFKAPVHGLNVKLTIDMELQTIVEEELDKALTLNNSKRGSIIVVEPKTGSIIAMASRPQFDLNTKDNMQEGALNFPVQGLYEPGSTFKVVSVTAAVDSGKATFNTPIDCRPVAVPGAKTPVSDGRRSYGTLPVKGILWKSSNPGAYNVGRRAGWEIYRKYVESFGFRSRTGIELPSETKGQIQDGSNIVNFSRITYGYSITVTPLQVAMAYAAIANDGKRMKPRLVDEIYSSNGALVEKREPEQVAQVMKVQTARDLREALAGVTEPGGTATRAQVEGYRVGGKTGTAYKVKETGGYYNDPSDERYTVSFVGMLPAKDPAFVCLVVIDEPRRKDCGIGGGTICAPVFKNVATRLASALNIPKEAGNSGSNKGMLAAHERKSTRR